jgi:transcriptional coactivator p15 (PC4)
MRRTAEILPEPIEVTKFWKNRRRDVAVVVSLSSYEGHNLVSIREHFTDSDGCMQPSRKGISLVVNRLPELAAGITKALSKAQDLGLLKETEGA